MNTLRNPITYLIFIALFAVSLVMTSSAHAAEATIDLTRSPAPPQAAVNNGTGVINYTFSIDYASDPDHYEVEIIRDDNGDGKITGGEGTPIPNSFVGDGCAVTGSMAGQPSPGVFSRSLSCSIPRGQAVSNYLIHVSYFARNVDPAICFAPNRVCVEHETSVNFAVASSVGNLVITKFEDLNANGVRDAGEPGVSGWNFSVNTPTITGVGTETHFYTTGADGTIRLPGVLTGNYTATEASVAGWTAISATTQSVTVNANDTSNLVFANTQLADVCGVAYLDANHNGVRDTNESARFSNVTIKLSNGQSAQTDGAGAYCFTQLVPAGGFQLDSSTPVNYQSCGDADGPANGTTHIGPFSLTSGQHLRDRDFGFCPLPAKLGITKTVNVKVVRQGGKVIWTITVRSIGPVTANDVVLNDPLIAHSTLVSTGGGRFRAGVLTWSLGDMAPGTSKTVRFTTKFDKNAKLGSYRNTATAGATNAPSVSASAVTRVIAGPKPKPHAPAVTG